MTTILIADDEPNVRLLVTTLVASARYNVLEATDGEEAWALLRRHRPALAILDVQMPGRSGLALARAVKDDPALAGTYVILLTARAQASDVAAGRLAGADAYLTKPFSPIELLAAIEQALAQAHVRR
jgi:CheY-like chemotaxis protein